jgi:hypothetical protein
MPLPLNGTNGNNYSLDNSSSAAPKLYLGSISGLGFHSGNTGAGVATNGGTSSLINQAGKSTL